VTESDYIMRTIKQFSEMLAALLFGKRAAGQVVNFSELDELSLSFTGLSLGFLKNLSAEQILSLYAATGELDIDKVYVTARLLYTLAEQEPETSAYRLGASKKVLRLLTEIHEQLGDFLDEEHASLIKKLGDLLKYEATPVERNQRYI